MKPAILILSPSIWYFKKFLSKEVLNLPPKARPKKNLSAIKRARQAEKRRLRNKAVRTSLKTVIKKVKTAVSSGNRESAAKALFEAITNLNKAASKGIIHKNTASRQISRLTKKVNAIPQAEAA
ncbi:MAG: 30S ribosomal protein S20 [Nitrospirae bacterium]|nr:30S ribosomal protein S20 [Nitrospirota bacterium]